MRLRVALVAAVAAIGAVVLFVRYRGSSADPPSSSAGKVAATGSDGTTAPTHQRNPSGHGRVIESSRPERPHVKGLPVELEPTWLAVEHAAKDCYRGRVVPPPEEPNGPDETVETLTVGYRAVSKDGAGHVEDVTVVRGALTDPDLQACILESVALATWDSVQDDGEISMEQEINLGDLQRPDHGPPPESERSPTPTAPPPPELARPLGERAPADEDHTSVEVYDPTPAQQAK